MWASSPTPAGAAAALTLSNTRLSLADTGGDSVPFALTATVPPLAYDGAGGVIPCVTGTAGFTGSYLEHGVRTIPEAPGYEASRWLSFLTDGGRDCFHLELGEVALPLPVCEFLTAPALLEQREAPALPCVGPLTRRPGRGAAGLFPAA